MQQGTAQFSEKFNVKIGTFCHLYNDILNEIKNVFSPDTATYIQKIEKEREAKERGEVKDNRSILAKYWMYIVPVVILLMVSSMANPDAAANGGGAAR
jgi:hypothetical protein